MPGSNTVPEYPSLQRAQAQAPGIMVTIGIFGDRVPVGTSVSPRFHAQPDPPLCKFRFSGGGSLCSRDGCSLGLREAECAAIEPHAMQNHANAAGQRNSRTFLPAPFCDIPRPSRQPIGTTLVQHHHCCLVERGAQPI